MDLREAYRAQRLAEFHECMAKLDLWQTKAKRASADLRVRRMEDLERLHGKLRTAREGLTRLMEAGDGAWDDLKEGVDQAWNDLRDAMESAETRFR